MQLASVPFFSHWGNENPRLYWLRGVDVNLGIDLQLDKWWAKNGGKVAVNLWCGHRWSVPIMGWLDDGVDYWNTRLSPQENRDHWWTIESEEDVVRFSKDFEHLLQGRAIPWFNRVKTKEGFLDWYSTVYPESMGFPYVLEVFGMPTLIQRVCTWLESTPPGIDRQLKWMVEVGVISEDLSQRLKLASIQSISDYQERIPKLIEELKQRVS